jgi:hypothetical protein
VRTNQTDHLLISIEKQCPEEYREYYGAKRQNFFAGVTRFPAFWHCCMRLDDILAHELNDIRLVADPYRVIPVMLFSNAHAQFRVYLELAFGGSFFEAFNVARMAIESSYRARKILAEPELQSIWTRKDRNRSASDEFDKKFDSNKKTNYAALGLSELHKYWRRFSLWSHPSVTALSQRLTPEAVMYFETDEKNKGHNLFEILGASFKIENALFDGYESRLKFDYELEKKRRRFCDEADRARADFIRKFKLKPPESPPSFLYA